MAPRIPLIKPTFPPAEQVADAYRAMTKSGIYANGGPGARKFMLELAAWTGVDAGRVALVASGTAALQVAMQALFRRERSHVLVASFTFAAGPLMIRHLRYSPVFMDIDPVSWHPSLTQARSFCAQEARTLAGLLLTNTFGTANEEIGEWEALATQYGIPLVIDSAAGFGSTYSDGEPLGRRGDCEVFSLHATKTLSVGEGGVVIGRDTRAVEKMRRLANFGFDNERASTALGTNAKLDELSARIGSLQLQVLNSRLAARRSRFNAYVAGLGNARFNFQPQAETSALPFVSVLAPDLAARTRILESLEFAGVDARTYYSPPVHCHPVFRSERSLSLTGTAKLSERILSLPMYDDLDAHDLERVCVAARQSVESRP